MALTLRNRHLTALTNSQLDLLNTARSRYGEHTYYQETGESTTKKYMYGMVEALSYGDMYMDFAMRVGKGFYMKLRNVEDFAYYDYRYPKSPGSTEALCMRKYNIADLAWPVPTTDNFVLPGYRIISLHVDHKMEYMFRVDNKPIFPTYQPRMDRPFIFEFESDGGAMFEIHHTAKDMDSVFNEAQYTYLTPTLTLGAYIEFTGIKSFDIKPRFDVRQYPILNQEPAPPGREKGMEIHLNLPPSTDPDEVYTVYIKYYKNHFTIDTGAGIDVVSHQLYQPKRYHVRGMELHSMIVVTGPELT